MQNLQRHTCWTTSHAQTLPRSPEQSCTPDPLAAVVSVVAAQQTSLERHTSLSSCARDTSQPAVRMILKFVRWEESLTFSSSKGYHRELLSSQSSKQSSVPASPAIRCTSSKKPRAHVRAKRPLRETINVSLARFTSRCEAPLPVALCEFPQEHKIRDTINVSFGTFHK